MAKEKSGTKLVARNRRARREFEIDETYEAGMVLVGSEVKSLREGNCSIEEAFARPKDGEIWLFDMHIAPYEQATIDKHDPKRPRKLLLHKREIAHIIAQCTQRGFTLVPTRVHFRNGHAKVEIALAHRRKMWDKRQKTAERQRRKDAEAALARRKRR